MPTFKLSLVQGPRSPADWEGTLAVEPDATLEDVHLLIQGAVEFDDDHGYEFFIARTHRSRDVELFDDENEQIFERTLASLFPLPARRALFYRFDYGDDWIFQIKPTRGAPSGAAGEEAASGLIGESGTRPVQYLDEDW